VNDVVILLGRIHLGKESELNERILHFLRVFRSLAASIFKAGTKNRRVMMTPMFFVLFL
jgi:hypothetical protein